MIGFVSEAVVGNDGDSVDDPSNLIIEYVFLVLE